MDPDNHYSREVWKMLLAVRHDTHTAHKDLEQFTAIVTCRHQVCTDFTRILTKRVVRLCVDRHPSQREE